MTSPTEHSEEELNHIFIKACEDQQKGLLDEAKAGYLKLLSFFSEAPILHYNLGLVYYAQERFIDARDSFQTATTLAPEDGDILYNLALSQKKCDDIEGAIKSYQLVLATAPESVDALYNLAGCYRDCKQYLPAVETYKKVLVLHREHLSATNSLAYLYHRLGENDEAINYYSKVLQLDPSHAAARHMLSSISGESITSAPDSYIKDVFDNYSKNYEQSLVTELEYCVPEKLRNLMKETSFSERTFQYGVDLGCGTGLSGEAFRDVVGNIDGIDLSEEMLEIAKKKEIYNSLHVGSIQDFLKSSSQKHDFFIAADVFGYIGDLTDIFHLLCVTANTNAVFCFSTETVPGDSFQVQNTGRFAHSCQYIEKLVTTTGWTIVKSKTASLRKEKDGWIEGNLWVLTVAASKHTF